jgi:hypothetical protein
MPPTTNAEPYVLTVPEGAYAAPSLGSLIWLVLRHRCWHWWRGEGWVD